jgi:hypothetical protein
MPQTGGSCGICGVCGLSLEALTRKKTVSWSKLTFQHIEGLKQTPLIPHPGVPFTAFSLKIQTGRPLL